MSTPTTRTPPPALVDGSVHLADILDTDQLATALEQRYVRRQHHPDEPLAILNYTNTCMYEKAWNPVTMACRGIIYRPDTGEVLARPWPKFFNYGEPAAAPFDLSARAVVTDKMDGSLGIAYQLPSGGHAIATRGSFTSEQARHATEVLNTRYADWAPQPGVTVLFEIIYRSNRVVLDYGELDELVFLGAVDTATGRCLPQVALLYNWPGPAVPVFEYNSLGQALTAPPRPNAEGLVVHFVDTDERCKLKQDDYVAMHRVLTGTSARTIWQYLAVNACAPLISTPKHWASALRIDPRRAAEILAVGPDWLETLIAKVPDEFYDWVKNTIASINRAVEQLRDHLRHEHDSRTRLYGDDRKRFAIAATEHPHSGALFLLLDGRDISTYVWQQAYPAADQPWMNRSEDVA